MYVNNKKAYYDYFVEDKIECGIQLVGTEIKSIRGGRVNLKDSWCSIVKNELFVNEMHISQYERGNIWNHEEKRVRKLLVHKKEINDLSKLIKLNGVSLIPLSLYFNDSGKVKLSIGVCKGKHNYDKRQCLKERDMKNQITKRAGHNGEID